MASARHGITSTEQGLTCPFPHANAPQNALTQKTFQSLCLKGDQDHSNGTFALVTLWDPNLIDRGERKEESPKLQVRCDADQDLEGEFMNKSFSCSDQRVQQIGWGFHVSCLSQWHADFLEHCSSFLPSTFPLAFYFFDYGRYVESYLFTFYVRIMWITCMVSQRSSVKVSS